MTTAADVEALIDLDRYPVADVESPQARALIARERGRLDETGLCSLPGFLRPGIAAKLAAEATTLLPRAHRQDHQDIAYGRHRANLESFPADHPVRNTSLFRMRLVAYDDMPEDGGIKTIYHWDSLTRLIGALTGNPVLHRTADPLLSCNVSVLAPGDTHGWHVDGNDFSVTLLLQEPEAGGRFEYAPVASPGDENFEAIGAIYRGERRHVVTPDLKAGTLSIFRGRWSLHHVTPVEGAATRLQVIFSYHVEPGMIFPEATRRNYLGRAT